MRRQLLINVKLNHIEPTDPMCGRVLRHNFAKEQRNCLRVWSKWFIFASVVTAEAALTLHFYRHTKRDVSTLLIRIVEISQISHEGIEERSADSSPYMRGWTALFFRTFRQMREPQRSESQSSLSPRLFFKKPTLSTIYMPDNSTHGKRKGPHPAPRTAIWAVAATAAQRHRAPTACPWS